MILEEFDENQHAVIDPAMVVEKVDGVPKIAVTCYSRVTFGRLVETMGAEVIARTSTANMEVFLYRAVYKNTEIALFMIPVGAAASVGILEDIFAMGVEKVVVFGTCGVLDASIENCGIIIPNRAVRDEGTSFHYAPPADEIVVNPKYIREFTAFLDGICCNYTIGKAWTTDAAYRETREKVERRKATGCICVDMECSANAAVAAFRGKELFQFFYAADNLDAEEWEARGLGNHSNLSEKDRIAILAMEFAHIIA
ncbi:MAG: nucleoside phosphorylase [Roseburia sp.]